jgi:hemoglobin-like flavoprotein
MGARHLRYGAQPHHYALARDAFLLALERQSGERWTPALATAWSAAFGAIASAMLRGAALETAAVADMLGQEDPRPG